MCIYVCIYVYIYIQVERVAKKQEAVERRKAARIAAAERAAGLTTATLDPEDEKIEVRHPWTIKEHMSLAVGGAIFLLVV